MIVGVIGGMVLHNLIVFRKKLILHRIGQPRILFRMTLEQRVQHLTLLISFFTLVLTGFALRYPSVVAGYGLRQRSGAQRHPPHRRRGADRGQLVHICGMSSTTPTAASLIKDMLPDWKDVTDARDAFRYYLGYSDQRPLFRRFTYAEKAEYWALVWGMFVMASTGLMVWFKVWGRRTGAGLVDRCCHHHPLVRSRTGHAGHHRVALVRSDLRSRCLSHELGVVRRQDVDRALRA